MGARPFLTVGRGGSARQAFWREVAAAIQTHGDDGDSGTIAEKWDFVEFEPSRAMGSLFRFSRAS
jgi:hypothetical protein